MGGGRDGGEGNRTTWEHAWMLEESALVLAKARVYKAACVCVCVGVGVGVLAVRN